MRVTRVLSVLFALAAASVAANADMANKETEMTFSGPVELPGVALPAGTYVFKLLDSASDRDIVQIFNQDETHVYATIIGVPSYRLEPTDDTKVSFEERPAGAPEAIRTWFYPGDTSGVEFVYPHIQTTAPAK
jgi:hypothetical protein